MNRILHLVKDGEDPMPERKLPQLTNMFEPAELYMQRDHLILMVKMNLAAIKRRRGELDITRADEKETDLAIRQREELLAWAKAHPDDMIYVALYPTTMEELKEEL